MTNSSESIDTSGVTLPSNIEYLTEELARHAYGIWTGQQKQDDIHHEESRDDQALPIPGLPPYEELDDRKKQGFRDLTMETLKVLIAKGCHITFPTDGMIRTDRDVGAMAAAETILEQMRAARERASLDRATPELHVLLQLWASRRDDDPAWHCLPDLYQHLGSRFLKLGEAPLAAEVARTALDQYFTDDAGNAQRLWGQDVGLRQIYGLALARMGNADDAQEILLQLRREGNLDQNTLGILARTYKDQAFLHPAGERHDRLESSAKIYREAYVRSDGFWTGINVATLERLLGNSSESEQVARQVQAQCLGDLEQQKRSGAVADNAYWHLATLGEAALIVGDIDEAGSYYRQAFQAAPKNFGDLNATRRHARWLLDYWIANGRLKSSDSSLLDEWLPLPRVAVFSGHMIDRAGRTPPRFPEEHVSSVRNSIRAWLTNNRALIGYSSAACGADLLFQQAIQDRGGESRIVLPYDVEQFKVESVTFAGAEWGRLFDKVLANATQVVIASPKRTHGDGISYDYANLVLHGLATLRAAELKSNEGQPVGLVVWNNQPGDGPGGTASVVRRWRDLGMDVDQIDLSSVASNQTGLLPIVKNPTPPETVCHGPDCESGSTRIMAMLFGDAVNFSKLDEDQVGRFMQHFMTPIAGIVHGYGDANVVRNTWGDGLYLVFDHVRAAGLCALDICEFVRRQIANNEWAAKRLPENLNVRLALHAGPVFGCLDPMTGQKNYTGTHVSRAARLEPKTPPGEVYASQGFAALCAEYRVSEFSCDYVKQLAWAKQYGSFPTFVLRRRRT